jgi:nucleoside-diphosphate-sugar epimerase
MIWWVTGAGGQIGSELCRQLASTDTEVIGIGRGESPESFSHRWVRWNIGIDDRPSAALGVPDAVIHLAGQTSAYRARNALESDIRSNVLGFAQVLLAALECGGSPFVVAAGAATEVGLVDAPMINDEYLAVPQTFYDVAKVAQGLYLQQFAAEGWLSGCRVRFANVYGGVEREDTDRGFLNRAVRRALAGETLNYFGDSAYGRDYIHVSDAASALRAAVTSTDLTAGETFMIGTGQGTRIRTALETISRVVYEVSGVVAPVIPVVPPAGMYAIERRDVVVDSGRFASLTGWSPGVTLNAGIREMVVELSAHRLGDKETKPSKS